MLNYPSTTQTNETEDNTRLVEDANINSNPHPRQKIVKVIKELKTSKAPGIDNVKYSNISAKILHKMFERILTTEKIPKEWKKVLLKKGDLTKCCNWITFLLKSRKILTRIILNHIKHSIDSIMWREQAGFSKNCE